MSGVTWQAGRLPARAHTNVHAYEHLLDTANQDVLDSIFMLETAVIAGAQTNLEKKAFSWDGSW